MKKRVFLVALVLFLLLAAMANQHVQNAAALIGGGRILGFIPLWQLYNILPAGIFTAGVTVAALGMGAEFWRALLPLCGATRMPVHPLSRLADAGLWCGWVTLASCITALACVFPATEGDNGVYAPDHQLPVLQVCGGGMILCRILAIWLRQKAALPIAVLCAAAALVCGQFWCRGQAIAFLSLALLLPWGTLLLWQPQQLRNPQFYLTIATLAMLLYGLSFAPTIDRYVLHRTATALYALPVLGVLLLMLLLKPLGFMQRVPMQRGAGGLIILSALCPLWHLVAAPAAGKQIAEHTALSIGSYAVPLLCTACLITLRLWVTAPPKTEEKQEN